MSENTKFTRAAFPQTMDIGNGATLHDRGLTIREYFAGLAMQGMLANSAMDLTNLEITHGAVLVADALLAALEADQ